MSNRPLKLKRVGGDPVAIMPAAVASYFPVAHSVRGPEHPGVQGCELVMLNGQHIIVENTFDDVNRSIELRLDQL